MPIDDSFLEKEAAKRRLFNLALGLVLLNFVVFGILFATGFLYENRGVSRLIIYSNAVLCLIFYFALRRKNVLPKGSKPPAPGPKRR